MWKLFGLHPSPVTAHDWNSIFLSLQNGIHTSFKLPKLQRLCKLDHADTRPSTTSRELPFIATTNFVDIDCRREAVKVNKV
jgi:hypothetical protein